MAEATASDSTTAATELGCAALHIRRFVAERLGPRPWIRRSVEARWRPACLESPLAGPCASAPRKTPIFATRKAGGALNQLAAS